MQTSSFDTRFGRVILLFIGQCFFFLVACVAAATEYRFKTDGVFYVLLGLWALSAWNLARYLTTDCISLRVIYWFYSSIFLGIAPSVFHATESWSHPIDQKFLIAAILVVAIGHMAYLGGYGHRLQKSSSKERMFVQRGKSQQFATKRLQIAVVVGFAVSVFLVASFGITFDGSIVRAIFTDRYSPLASILEYLVRPSIFFILIYIVVYKKYFSSGQNMNVFLALSVLSVCLVVGPFSGNRSLIFTLYFALFLTVYTPSSSRAIAYGLILFIGIFGFYFQEMIRVVIGGGESVMLSTNFLTQGNFDGFENLVHVISYVELHGLSLGWQFLGATLFFIPRSVWEEKPTGTGDTLASNFLAVTNGNIATPLISELYINFHLFGVVFIMYAFGFISSILDRRYKILLGTSSLKAAPGGVKEGISPSFRVCYSVLMGLYLFILRGDLMSGLSFLVGTMLALCLITRIVVESPRQSFSSVRCQ